MGSPLWIEFDYAEGEGRLTFSGDAVRRWDPVDRVIEHISPGILSSLTKDLQDDLVSLRKRFQDTLVFRGYEQAVGKTLSEYCSAGTIFWHKLIGSNPAQLL